MILKVKLLFLVFFVFAFSQEKNYEHQVENTNEYITASTMFNTQNYRKSYELFHKLFLKHNYNININYFLANSAIRLGKYDEATLALERVLSENPNFNEARLLYARLLYKQGERNNALKEFETLKKAKINNSAKKLVNTYIKELKIEPKYWALNSTLLLGIGRSSNVNSAPLSSKFNLPGLNNIEVSGAKPIADSFHNEMINLTHSKFFKTYPNVKIDNNLTVFNQNYFREEDEDITVTSYKPSISYYDKKSKTLYSFQVGANKIYKKNNDNFLNYLLQTSIRSKNFYSYLGFQKNLYEKEKNKGKNFSTYELLLQYKVKSNLALYSKFSKNIRENKERIDINKVSKQLGFRYFYSINNKNMLQLNTEYVFDRYKHFNEFFQSKRRDNKFYTNLSYLYSITDDDKLIFSSSFTRNNSNQKAYMYEKVEGRLNYIKSFSW